MKKLNLLQALICNDCQISRRNFLKSSGLTLMCINLLSCADQNKQFDEVSWIEQVTNFDKYALGVVLGDPYLCNGCRRCEIVCSSIKHSHLTRPEGSLIKLDRKRYTGLFVEQSVMWAPDTCRQCQKDNDSPWCVSACPTGACHIDNKSRIRKINQEVCIGCASCVEACPYHMPHIDTLKSTAKAPDGVASKCDLCSGTPACVLECPTGSLQFYKPWVKKKKLSETI